MTSHHSNSHPLSTTYFVRAASLSDFDNTGCITAQLNGHTLAMFKYGDQVYAVDNRCPHMGFPLSKGTVRDGILTCYWHYARFDLATGGTFDQFADDVPSFPVEIRDNEVWVDLTPPGNRADYYRKRLTEGLERDIPLVIAKSVINLLEGGTDPIEPFRIGLEYGTRYRNAGWGQGLTILTCMQNILPHLHVEDRSRALYQGLAAVTRETTGNAPRFIVSPLPGETPEHPTLKRWFRQFIEVRDDEGAERCIVSALRAGADHRQMADMLFAAVTDHRYIQLGHPLDFTNKAFEALTLVGWGYAESVLTSLVHGYAQATRMEESNAWRYPIDLINILDDTFEQISSSLEEGKNRTWGWSASTEIVPTLLGDDPKAIVAELLNALENGCTPIQLATVVAYAAALRIARFHTSNEFTDWDSALHTFTFANAVHQSLRRLQSDAESYRYSDSLRGVFDAAMSVYLGRFLNIPAARIPKPNGSEASSTEILSILTARLDKQQQVNQAGNLVADYLYSDGKPKNLLATLGNLLLREDRDFHTIQTIEAAFRQFQLLEDKPEATHVLIAASRYLAAHAPTVRAQVQTYGIAWRLARGDKLYEE